DLIAVTYRIWTPDNCTFRVYPNDGGHFTNPYLCIANPYQDYGRLTENLLSLGDYDNDDDLDLVVDLYEIKDPGGPCPYWDTLYLMTNDGGVFDATPPIAIDTFTQCSWPMDISWGDYDRDGDLDLAAAIPVLSGPASQQVRIYRNQTAEGAGPGFPGGAAFILDLPFQFPPFAVQWGNLDVDGDLDLAVAGSDSALRIYLNSQGSFASNRFLATPEGAANTFALDLAGADYDNDGDWDLAVGNPLGPSALFHTFASRLSAGLSQIAAWSAGSVTWGDADRDGSLDLLFGASGSTVNARLYYNEDGSFPDYVPFSSSGFGPQSAAFGDMNGDGALDIALGTPVEIQVYFQGNRDTPDWLSPPYLAGNSLAWSDADDDGDLDLALAAYGSSPYFVNQGGMLAAAAAWSTGQSDDTRSLAWGDYNNDRYLDLAIGNYNQPNRIYHNDGDNSFSLAWSAPQAYATTSVAWADYDGDGDPDLAVGNFAQPNLIYENTGGGFGPEPVWASTEVSQTTRLAWGDWDNDGDLDLAVGNRNQRNQVYLNQHSRPGLPRLIWLWSSAQAYPTTGIAWGDRDGDGDLDLAISSESHIGIYNNNYVIPAHLTELFTPTMPLPNNPSYAAVERPGITDHAYFYSSADILSGPMQPTVTVHYELFDPDGTRQSPGSNEPGDIITRTLFEFSVDGGATWQPATPSEASRGVLARWAATGGDLVTTTCRLGQEATFVWDAVADAAISDDARFRISVIPYNPSGPVQRAMTSAVSPPFRIRGTSCIWPRDPAIAVSDPHPDPGESVSFEGSVAEASGILTFTWDFGDGSTAVGQVVEHAYGSDGIYAVRLTVRSEPCPIYKEVFANLAIPVGTGVPNIFLPVVVKSW
ncbi:MAG: VCBS repeat-containing protein, partial [Anaerolineae bacterium]|nr:VCBS repeat-containing protein [Anaerolineae bacterium]